MACEAGLLPSDPRAGDGVLNKAILVQLPLTTLGQETRWTYSTPPPGGRRASSSSKCGQCHVYRRRRRLNTDMSTVNAWDRQQEESRYRVSSVVSLCSGFCLMKARSCFVKAYTNRTELQQVDPVTRRVHWSRASASRLDWLQRN